MNMVLPGFFHMHMTLWLKGNVGISSESLFMKVFLLKENSTTDAPNVTLCDKDATVIARGDNILNSYSSRTRRI